MQYTINYKEHFNKAFQKIKAIRDESSKLPFNIKPSLIFNIEDDNYKTLSFVLENAYKEFYIALSKVLVETLTKYNNHFICIQNAPIFAFINNEDENRVLYYFKKWGFPTDTDKRFVGSALANKIADSFKYISLVDNNAQSYIFYNKVDDNGNIIRTDYSLKELYYSLFDLEEYNHLTDNINSYKHNVSEYIGYITVKNLTPSSTYEFKRKLESELLSKDHFTKLSNHEIDSIPCNVINQINTQFYSNEFYRSILADNVFGESFLTAEWMYSSLSEVKNVDLTIIALGYFKAVEQLMHDYIVLHSDEDRKIKKMSYIQNKPPKIFLNKNSIERKMINFMLDSMITFFDDYHDLFDKELGDSDIEYIIQQLDKLKSLRNEYFHKDNINELDTITKARNQAILVISLLLGCLYFRTEDLESFKLSKKEKDESQSLFEYMYYHSYSVYYIMKNNKMSNPFVATRINEVSYNKKGVAFFPNPIINIFLDIKSTDNKIPLKMIIMDFKVKKEELSINDEITIFEGTMIPSSTENGMDLSGPIKTIFKNGKFVAE